MIFLCFLRGSATHRGQGRWSLASSLEAPARSGTHTPGPMSPYLLWPRTGCWQSLRGRKGEETSLRSEAQHGGFSLAFDGCSPDLAAWSTGYDPSARSDGN